MHHAVVEYQIQGKVAYHENDPEHVRTDHAADYDSHNSPKSSASGGTGTDTYQDFFNKCEHSHFPSASMCVILTGRITFRFVYIGLSFSNSP